MCQDEAIGAEKRVRLIAHQAPLSRSAKGVLSRSAKTPPRVVKRKKIKEKSMNRSALVSLKEKTQRRGGICRYQKEVHEENSSILSTRGYSSTRHDCLRIFRMRDVSAKVGRDSMLNVR